MPHPTIVGDANIIRTDEESPVEIVKIMNRPFLSAPIASRTPRGQQGSGRRIGHIEPVPAGPMNRDYPPIDFCKSKRERDGFLVVRTAIKNKGNPAVSEVND